MDVEYQKDGFPQGKEYLECDLPEFLKDAIDKMNDTWSKKDRGEYCPYWDCDYCELQSDINIAEVEQMISSEQAWYLREKYLRIERV